MANRGADEGDGERSGAAAGEGLETSGNAVPRLGCERSLAGREADGDAVAHRPLDDSPGRQQMCERGRGRLAGDGARVGADHDAMRRIDDVELLLTQAAEGGLEAGEIARAMQ